MRLGAIPILAALMMAAAPSAMGAGREGALPDSRLGIRTAPLLLLSRPDVRADLGLDEAQAADAEAAIRTLYIKAQGLKGMKGEAAVAARRQIDEEQQQWLETRLSDDQRRRLLQVDLQWEGPAALVSRPAVAAALNLTREQRVTLKRAVDEFSRRRAQGQLQAHDEPELARQVLAVLSEPQKEGWKAMLGRPFVPRLASTKGNGPR